MHLTLVLCLSLIISPDMRAPNYVISFKCSQPQLFAELNGKRGRTVTLQSGTCTWRLFCKTLDDSRVGVWTSLLTGDAKPAMAAFAASSFVQASDFSLFLVLVDDSSELVLI